MNFIENTRLEGAPCGRALQKRGSLVPGWNYESKSPSSAVVEREEDSGFLSLRLNGSSPWFRLYQEIRLPAEATDAAFRAEIEIAGVAGHVGPSLDSIRLLEADDSGKFIAISDSRDSAVPIGGESVVTLVRDIVPKVLNPARPIVLAVQFSGGPGAVMIRRIGLWPQRAPQQQAQSITAPVPAATVVPRPAAPLRFEQKGSQLSGQIQLPDTQDGVLVFIDGKPAAPAPVSVPLLRPLSFEIPQNLQDGKPHTISVRQTDGTRLGRASVSLRPADAATGASALSGLQRGLRKRIAVVSWDMGHNPAGRAYMLAEMASRHHDTQIVGPLFPAYGGSIWEPIAQSPIPMETFPAPDFKTFIAGARDLAARITCDAVYVSKPRLPGLLLGALIKQANRCPMILDIDDHELSFFRERSIAGLSDVTEALAADPSLLDKPYGEIFTRYAETLVSHCDAVTVSNYALQQRFGGIVVRHGRDETQFDPDLHDRDKIRAEFGYGPRDCVIVFLGTARAHKGIVELADALEELGDDRIALCVIGTANDKRITERFAAYRRARISLHPFQPWSRIPELVNMADGMFLLQDPESPVSEYQIPAKLTDGVAMGTPVFVTPVPPLRDLIAAGAVHPVETKDDILAALRRLAAGGRDEAAAARRRSYFLTELSTAANAARIETALVQAEAVNRRAIPAFDRMFEAIETASGTRLPRFTPAWTPPAVWRNTPPDVVFFWKQNDSDLYGRRSDMMVKYLIETGAARRVIHFDAPIRGHKVEQLGRENPDGPHQGPLVHANALRRHRKQADTAAVARRTFIYNEADDRMSIDGAELPPLDAYPDFVAKTLGELAVSGSPLMWVCPVISGYAALKKAVTPRCTVADIIDDQRTMPMKDITRRKLIRDYEAVLSDADIVLANCDPVKAAFADLRTDIQVVANGAEVFDIAAPWEVPDRLAALPRPIIGYVGNLRDRVDSDLIRKVARAHPGGSVVLIGSAHGDAGVMSLAAEPNVHFFGVVPYADATRYIRAFDAAIVPHLRNAISERMNPLKLYVYFALGTPIVTTDVANIDDIRPFASVADSHEAFLSALDDVLQGGGVRPVAAVRETLLGKLSWQARIREIAALIGLPR